MDAISLVEGLVARHTLQQKRHERDGILRRERGIDLASLMGTPDPAPVVKVEQGQRRVVVPKPVVVAAAPPKVYSVEAIKAAKRSEEVIK